jgi:RimJ/RimL family protein N-acetyltransferase
VIDTTSLVRTTPVPLTPAREAVSSDWKTALPVLHANKVTLRELRLSDAPFLLAFLNVDEVNRFISPPPTTVDGFERFVEWTHRERAAGSYVCFGVVPEGCEHAVGLFQVRQLNGSFEIAEWGFAIGSEFWGSGVFVESAQAVLKFTFDTIGTARVEARASVGNGRGNGALQKLGATREGILRKAFLRSGEYHDQALWAIVAAEWRESMTGAHIVRH